MSLLIGNEVEATSPDESVAIGRSGEQKNPPIKKKSREAKEKANEREFLLKSREA